ncbi:hypothetical protein L6452_30742 [Arctium lappa]|uniref:Uncharacterized protein n=1 Tax=Arctium lappa TaxID=4217 RepID=A0ACB8ZJD4_ARCLA|nr:hypothetical protein L6452_30742 [Arctium lappa]
MSKVLVGILKAVEAKLRKSQASAKKRAISIFTTMSVAHVDDEASDADVCHTEKIFSNGDIYIGQWATDYPHGNGKYLWPDGCMYLGEWYKGKIRGKGKFSWPSGSTYEGQFKNGYMNGEGTFTGSLNDTYRGSWVMNRKQGKGTQSYANGDHYEGGWRKGFHDGQGRYHWNSGHQYIGQWKKGKMNGNGTMIWANGNRYDGSWEDGLPKGNGTFHWQDGSFYAGVWSRDQKEQSGKFYPSTSQDPHDDWDPNQLFSVEMGECLICEGENVTIFPSDKTFSWSSGEGKAPRKNSRANGNLPHSFTDVLKRMLPAYFEHVKSFENTLVTKFFGLHCVKLSGPIQKKVRFVIMGNLLCTEVPIHRRFDLKGSSHGRITDKPESEIDANTTLKDLDLKFIFRLQKDWFQEFCSQVNKDCDFLEQERIMDYSLLVGISFQDMEATEGNAEPDCIRTTSSFSSTDVDLNPALWASVRLGINMPARVEFTVRSHETQLVGEPTGEFCNVILFFGIIDILQDYDISKKLEHAYKSFQYDSTSISAVDPRLYSKRFRDFIFRVFADDS